MARRHAVALFDKGSTKKNVIVLGAELVLPLEADLDGDPDQDDEVRLVGPGYDVTRSAQADEVEIHPDKPVLLYRFPDVPRGEYSLLVKIGDTWSTVVPKLSVKKDGVFVGDKAVSGSLDDLAVGEALGREADEEEEQPDYEFYDQPEDAREEQQDG